jgi:hypothetical protein
MTVDIVLLPRETANVFANRDIPEMIVLYVRRAPYTLFLSMLIPTIILGICPMAYDPITLPQFPNRRTIRLVTGVEDGTLSGSFEFSFAGSTVLLDSSPYDLDSRICTEKLSGLRTVEEITCFREKFSEEESSASYLITILSYPERSHLNNVYYHNGNPSLDFFSCSTNKIDSSKSKNAFCKLSDVVTEGIPEYKQCAGHGSCDSDRGTCQCEPGFRSESCGDIRDDKDILVHSHEGPFFTASLLKLDASRSESPDFNLLQTKVAGKVITTMRGDGLFNHSGDLVINSGTITAKTIVPPPSTRSKAEKEKSAEYYESIVAQDHANVSFLF